MVITQTDPFDPGALTLIDGSEREQSALYPPEYRTAFTPQELVDGDIRFFVGRENQDPVACGGYGIYADYAELKRIFVDIHHRGRGYADAMILHLEEAAAQEGFALMRLETGVYSPAALKVYTRLGYTKIGPFGAYPDYPTSVFMEKTIPASSRQKHS